MREYAVTQESSVMRILQQTDKRTLEHFVLCTVKPRYTGSKNNGNPPITNAERKSLPFFFTFFVKKLHYNRIQL